MNDDILNFISSEEARARIQSQRRRIARLLDRGVLIPAPESVEIDEDVILDRIAPGVVLHAGTRLRGAETWLAEGVRLGAEAPVCLERCVLGPGVRLDGGFFQNATFLDGVQSRSGAHVREGTLLEEHASIAHCVGLKQTILFPYVTLGSLINFCDCLMAGGTGKKDHSEVGSGYIHFNFTPWGDKATPSLFGDVPRGVLLTWPRIFLGGMSASAGPLQVGYGSFLGPGNVWRRDVPEGRFLLQEKQPGIQREFDPRVFSGLLTRVLKNIRYVAHLHALRHWYLQVRRLFEGGPWTEVYAAARGVIEGGLKERERQLERLFGAIPESVALLRARGGPERLVKEQEQLVLAWPDVQETLQRAFEVTGPPGERDQLLEDLAGRASPGGYLHTISSLGAQTRAASERWLRGLVEEIERDGARALRIASSADLSGP